MHEAAVAQNIIDAVCERLEVDRIPGRVQAVCLQVGKLTAVVPDNLRFMFQVLAVETPLEGVRLEIEQVPVRLSCRACGLCFEPEDVCFICRGCSSADVEIARGRELLIEALEVE
jgi:hydrogenase nickel incorporation protein HypA/HybF